MYWLIGLMILSLLGVMGLGVYLETQPREIRIHPRRLWLSLVGLNLTAFVGAGAGLLFMGAQDVMAQAHSLQPEAGQVELSIGMGLSMIGVGLPTAVATFAAALAVGPIGAAALAVIAEKPDQFGRSLIYLGLAEGIAIYGLVLSILMLGKIP